MNARHPLAQHTPITKTALRGEAPAMQGLPDVEVLVRDADGVMRAMMPPRLLTTITEQHNLMRLAANKMWIQVAVSYQDILSVLHANDGDVAASVKRYLATLTKKADLTEFEKVVLSQAGTEQRTDREWADFAFDCHLQATPFAHKAAHARKMIAVVDNFGENNALMHGVPQDALGYLASIGNPLLVQTAVRALEEAITASGSKTLNERESKKVIMGALKAPDTGAAPTALDKVSDARVATAALNQLVAAHPVSAALTEVEEKLAKTEAELKRKSADVEEIAGLNASLNASLQELARENEEMKASARNADAIAINGAKAVVKQNKANEVRAELDEANADLAKIRDDMRRLQEERSALYQAKELRDKFIRAGTELLNISTVGAFTEIFKDMSMVEVAQCQSLGLTLRNAAQMMIDKASEAGAALKAKK
jgi:hypothetical protein